MFIRKADQKTDHDAVWEIFSRIIRTGDTYVFDPNSPKDSLHQYWFADNMDTFVAVDQKEEIVGTYFIKPNQLGLGNHIANCGYMVNPDFHGQGIGTLLCEHSVRYAKENGYLGIQFNIVVSTNIHAVNLWKKLSFEIIGTTPNGFRHQELGLVDTYIMFRDLQKD